MRTVLFLILTGMVTGCTSVQLIRQCALACEPGKMQSYDDPETHCKCTGIVKELKNE